MPEIEWIKISTGIFDDEKIKKMGVMPDAEYLKVSKRTIERMIQTNQNAFLEYFAKEAKFETMQRAVNGGRGRK